MRAVDTNILLNCVNADSPDRLACAKELESMANGRDTWCLTWGVIYEFLRVATHPRVFPKPLSVREAWAHIEGMLRRPNCVTVAETADHAAVFRECLSRTPNLRGNILHDFHTAVILREHGVVEILSLDRDFRVFPWIRRVTPGGVE